MTSRTASDAPPGWPYNPSAWSARLPTVAVAMLGGAVATYLALYQLGAFPTVWEPFFGQGSERVLHSFIVQMLPIPDALVGVAGYGAEVLTGLIGGRARWRTRPWMVAAYVLVVWLMAGTSVLLLIVQPVFVGAWCTMCIASAVVSIVLVGPTLGELLATLQYLNRAAIEGRPAWRLFWGLEQEQPSPATMARQAARVLGR